jgi:hypothetical protein
MSRSDSRDGFAKDVFAKMESWDFSEGAKLMEHSYVGNVLPETVVGVLSDRPARVVWAGDYADPEDDGNALHSMEGVPKLDADPRPKHYIVNLDRGEYVDLGNVAEVRDEPGWKIHPLPLLCNEGNGRGGGDFRGENKYLGTWARDLLTATDERPEGLKEIRPNFVEA